jgi:hypothetical protein
MASLLNYAPLISAVASTLMLVIWGVYLDVFWRSYRRRHRAKIIIGRGEGMGPESLCLISNMGAEPIHIEGVILAAEQGGQRWHTAIAGISLTGGGARPKKPSREGPLKSGDYIVLGTFRDLLEAVKRPASPVGSGGPQPDVIEICLVADLSTESELVFTRRRFLIRSHTRGIVFRPEGLETRRIRRTRERREIERILTQHLEEATTGAPSPGAERRAGAACR